jgi:hypothetical protein
MSTSPVVTLLLARATAGDPVANSPAPTVPAPTASPVRKKARRLLAARLVRCPCHGLPFLRVAESPSLSHVVRRASRIPALAAAGQRDLSASTARAARRCRAGASASSGPRLTIAAADRLRLSARLCSTFQWLST